ncbi:MAG: alpha/beta hydrolase [Epsilonproteobacteria bacterium]|nr:alpha/beta hydrolase [Campylobacterota bacterium]
MTEKPFSKKIHYLYQKLNLKEREFTMLFYSKNRDSFASRHTTVHKSWREKGIKQVKGFYFDEYVISTYTIGDEVAFTKESFMSDTFEEFKERVDRYVEYDAKSIEQFDYRYIYYFDINQQRISYVMLNSIEKISSSKYTIEIVSPRKGSRVQKYRGTVKIIDGYFYIFAKNNFEIINFLFILDRGYRNNDKVHGIKLGRSILKGLPQANKELLTKEKLTEEEEKVFYLIANESDCLISTEVWKDIFNDKNLTYINKFQSKISELETYSKKSKKIFKDEFETDAYFNVFYKNFINLSKISKNFLNNQSYCIYRRKSDFDIFLKSISKRYKNSCYIVHPLYSRNSKIHKADLVLNEELSEDELIIKRIIIVDKNYDISRFIQRIIKKIIKLGVDIKIAFNEDIEELDISSDDFIYTKEKDIAIYQTTFDSVCRFKITKDKERIQELFYDFKKIESISLSFDEYLLNQEKKEYSIVKVTQLPSVHLQEENFVFHKNSFIDYPLQIEESHIIGEKILYIDNHLESKNLVFMFHGLGLDHNDFRAYIEKSNYHCIAPTLYGFNKNENIKDILSYKTHCYLLACFVKDKIDEIQPRSVTLVGFSIGGDMIQDIVYEYPFVAQKVNAVIILDCNINIHTCTISKRIASLNPHNEENIINIINSFNQGISELKEWLQVQQYLIKVFSKFIDRLHILSLFAKEITNRLEKDTDDGFECFTSNFKNTTKKIDHVQYIFSDDNINKKLINTINFINLNSQILGDDYNESSIRLEREHLHFDLLEYKNLKSYIDASFEMTRIKNV